MADTEARGGHLDRQREPLPTRVEGIPPLAPAFSRALDAALLDLGVALGNSARAAIEGHVRLLLAWNGAINLTAITEPSAIAIQHVADSLAAVPLLEGRPTPGSSLQLLDLGSGGGFPGIPIAAAATNVHATLVESVVKKARFLGVAIDAVGLSGRVGVAPVRAEALAADGRSFDVVCARAVAGLGELVELAMPLLRTGGRLLAWKRGDIEGELESAARASALLGGGPPVIREVPVAALSGHLIVEIAKATPTPPGFPRNPVARRRRPW